MRYILGARAIMLTALALNGCSYPRHSYSSTDEFFASGKVPVPSEFRRGTASRSEVDSWSSSLLAEDSLEFDRVDINGDRVGELFVSSPAYRGTGGNDYLVFREGRRGFTYLGRLFYGSLRPIAADDHGRARVITYSWMGSAECMITIRVLRPDGFHSTATRILPCGDSAADGEGGRLAKLLFDSAVPSPEVLQMVFGSEL